MGKEIYLKQAKARNFKGLGGISFDFTERESTLVGANGTGKSSFFAMFIWCLFGKDQFGRADHEIKTRIDGKTDRYKECEVELVLSINGEETRLKRIYSENWVRPKGESEDVFKGNETKRYINDVEVKASEYDREVYNICPEDIFRVITNPSYFPNLKQDEQRAILFKMVGDITNESIAKGNKDFEEFLHMLSGKSFEVFKKEVSAQKKRVKDEAESIPARIDELKRSFPDALDWDVIQTNLKSKKLELEAIEAQLGDASKLSEHENNKRLELRNQINKIEEQNQNIQFAINREHNEKLEGIKESIRKLRLEEGSQNHDYNTKSARLSYLQTEKIRIEEILKSLGDDWKRINNQSLTFKDGEFDCPTCKRPLDVDDIETKQHELEEEFNKKKASELSKNVEEGKARKAELDTIVNEITSIGELKKTDTSDIQTRIINKESELVDAEKSKPSIENNESYKANLDKINNLKKEMDTPIDATSTNDLNSKKTALVSDIEQLNADLAKKSMIENTQKRIKELTELQSTLNQELGALERKEFIQKSFEFAKNESYEKQINEMFTLVQFNLFRQQVDGQIVPTCEAHVNGVPYSTQNNAMQVAMGLDIIDSISKYEGVYAPIFLDNREGVTSIPVVQAQVINLFVKADESKLRML